MPLKTEQVRASILARMINTAPDKKLGRTQVMKLFYFLQELKCVQLGYDFRLFTYGPFDSEVLSDLATSCNLGTVVERTVIYPRGYGYEITPTAQAEQLSQELENANGALSAQVDEVVNEFGGFSASELELRSTILFVDREMASENQNVTSNEIADRVRQIKPHFSQETIFGRITIMKNKNQLLTLDG
jgi:uncharacterized protein YwgA